MFHATGVFGQVSETSIITASRLSVPFTVLGITPYRVDSVRSELSHVQDATTSEAGPPVIVIL